MFGKLPLAGDFVARGLPRGLRPVLDRWLTLTLAGARDWPDGGWRVILSWPEGTATTLVLPSCDRLGRSFPLAGLCITPGVPAPEEAETWCEAAAPSVLAAAVGELDADELHGALARQVPPVGPGPPLAGPLVWRRGEAPRPLSSG